MTAMESQRRAQRAQMVAAEDDRPHFSLRKLYALMSLASAVFVLLFVATSLLKLELPTWLLGAVSCALAAWAWIALTRRRAEKK